MKEVILEYFETGWREYFKTTESDLEWVPTFAYAESKVPTVKKMRRLKSKFVEFCGLASWKDAQAAYPDFADEEMLKAQFISLSKDMQPLADYCQKAMR